MTKKDNRKKLPKMSASTLESFKVVKVGPILFVETLFLRYLKLQEGVSGSMVIVLSLKYLTLLVMA